MTNKKHVKLFDLKDSNIDELIDMLGELSKTLENAQKLHDNVKNFELSF